MYYFYMGSVLLPIAPEKFTLKVKNTNKTIKLINEGEVNLLKEAGLTELEFDALIPAVQYSFAKYEDEFKPIAYFTSHFEKLKTSKEPFQFMITRKMPEGSLLFDTNMTVSMESYTIKEDVKQGFDLIISFKLKQYKPFGTKIVTVVQPELSTNKPTVTVKQERPQTQSPAPKQESTYTVKRGDCLWNIAKAVYGDGSKYKAIYEANKDKISNPNSIHEGMVLRIPDVDQAKVDSANVEKLKEKTSKKVKVNIITNAKDYGDSFTVTYMYDNSWREKGINSTCSINVDCGSTFKLSFSSRNINYSCSVPTVMTISDSGISGIVTSDITIKLRKSG